MTSPFKAHGNVLLRSIRADRASDLFRAHLSVGDLDLSREYTERTWHSALAASARACKSDARAQLEDALFYECQQRPSAGSGSGAAENWMYGWKGSLLVEDDITAGAVGVLMRACSLRGLASKRDHNAQNYRRFLSALSNLGGELSKQLLQGCPRRPIDAG